MKKIFIGMVFVFSFINIFAGDMCEIYAKYMPGNESYPVKIGICNRSLYEECKNYSEKEDLCIEILHYAGDQKIASR